MIRGRVVGTRASVAPCRQGATPSILLADVETPDAERDAHALDTSTRLATLVARALTTRDGPADERSAWERAGLPWDLVSVPVLT